MPTAAHLASDCAFSKWIIRQPKLGSAIGSPRRLYRYQAGKHSLPSILSGIPYRKDLQPPVLIHRNGRSSLGWAWCLTSPRKLFGRRLASSQRCRTAPKSYSTTAILPIRSEERRVGKECR